MADGARRRTAAAGRSCATCSPAAGVAVTGVDGINLWMRVADERSAAVALAARGIGVAPGEPFLVRPDDDHLRVTVGLLTGPDDHVRESPTTSPTPPAAPRPARPTTAEPVVLHSARSGRVKDDGSPCWCDDLDVCDDLDDAVGAAARGCAST